MPYLPARVPGPVSRSPQHSPAELLMRRHLIPSTLQGLQRHDRNAATTSFLLQVTLQTLAPSRPPACHQHLASNSSCCKSVLSRHTRHTMPATAEQSSYRKMCWLERSWAQV